jgi:hypothetical protein
MVRYGTGYRALQKFNNKTLEINEFLPEGFYASENGQIASPAQSHIRSSKVEIIGIPFIGAFAFFTNQFQTKFELLDKKFDKQQRQMKCTSTVFYRWLPRYPKEPEKDMKGSGSAWIRIILGSRFRSASK